MTGNRLSLDETRERCEFELECTIVAKYWDLIPGARTPVWGVHWLFDLGESLAVARKPSFMPNGNQLNDASLLLQMGFWTVQSTFDGRLHCEVGDRIRTHLVFFPTENPYTALTPVMDSDFGIVDAASGKPRMAATPACSNTGLARGYPPITIAYGMMSEMNSYGGDLQWAAKQWNDATGSQIQIWPIITNPSNTHYMAGFGQVSVPSYNAETWDHINGKRPGPVDQYKMVFNESRAWSAPGQNATSSEYDFKSIALHEIGHAVGLDHIAGSSKNVMRAGHARGEIRKELQADDIDCMQQLLN